MPSIILEIGYSKPWPKVQEDRDLWLQGGAPFVNAIVLIKWTKRSNGRVAGFIEVHRPGGQQGIQVVSSERIRAKTSRLANILFSRTSFRAPHLELRRSG